MDQLPSDTVGGVDYFRSDQCHGVLVQWNAYVVMNPDAHVTIIIIIIMTWLERWDCNERCAMQHRQVAVSPPRMTDRRGAAHLGMRATLTLEQCYV
jgi:hypothetical protein